MTERAAAPSSRASKLIPAPAEDVYAAFVDPRALLEWLPPAEMTGQIHEFDGRVGGGYTMSLFYPPTEREHRGKSADREDRVRVRFLELAPPRRIVEAVTFVTDDPSFAGEMTMTVMLADAPGGTEATLEFTNLPPGLRPADNDEGARLSLDQLARRFAPLPARED
ncbi:MAG TPA: SRPBCC domain-containing protein [Longimicrobiaceae bacterium]